MKFLDNYQEQAYSLLRIMSGFLFLWHGAQKLFGFPVEFPYPLNPLMTAAISSSATIRDFSPHPGPCRN